MSLLTFRRLPGVLITENLEQLMLTNLNGTYGKLNFKNQFSVSFGRCVTEMHSETVNITNFNCSLSELFICGCGIHLWIDFA